MRRLLFNQESPMTIEPKFLKAMEKSAKPGVLALIYEKQLRQDIDRENGKIHKSFWKRR